MFLKQFLVKKNLFDYCVLCSYFGNYFQNIGFEIIKQEHLKDVL